VIPVCMQESRSKEITKRFKKNEICKKYPEKLQFFYLIKIFGM
jgi:hypothetical protein